MSDQPAEKQRQLLAMQSERGDSLPLSQLLAKAEEFGFSDAEIKKLRTMYGSHFERGNA